MADCYAYNCRVDIVLLPPGKKSAQFYPHNADNSGVMWQISNPALNLTEIDPQRRNSEQNGVATAVTRLPQKAVRWPLISLFGGSTWKLDRRVREGRELGAKRQYSDGPGASQHGPPFAKPRQAWQELRLNFGVIALIRRHSKSRPTILKAGANERGKQRMRSKRLRFEFRMKLAANEPRMIRHFDNFDIHAIGCPAGNAESGARERLLVLAIKFVAMAVALGDFECAVSLMRKRARLEFARPRAQPHRAAHLVYAEQFAQLVNHAISR